MADDAPKAQLRQQVRELERRLDDTREELAAVKNQPVTPGMIEALGLDTQMGRRQAMLAAVLGGGAAAGALTAATGPAQADEVAADVGTQADPWRTGFFAALNAGDGQQLTDWETGFNTHAVTKSSAYTTSGEHFIDVDTSAAGVTITLATADTVLGHYIVLRQNGSNDLVIDTEGSENIDGSSSLTLQHDQAMVYLWSDGSNWFSNQFIDTVDARTITTEDIAINGTSEGTTTQYIDSLDGGTDGGELRVQQTDGVSTSATAILTMSNDVHGAKVVVVGDAGSNNRFYEVLHYARQVGITTTESLTQNSPPGRTYSRDGNELDLALASGTADVVAHAIAARMGAL